MLTLTANEYPNVLKSYLGKEFESLSEENIVEKIFVNYDALLIYLDSKGYKVGIYTTLEKVGECFTVCVRIKGNKKLTFITGTCGHSMFLIRDEAMKEIIKYCLNLLEKELK